ncbi:MAG TPA: alpha/beta hydrolase [Ideonella sp.]|nr:alpha/beta hydrolase [Ideonella sp.]
MRLRISPLPALVLSITLGCGLQAGCGGGGGAAPAPTAAVVGPLYAQAHYTDSQLARYPEQRYSTRPNEGGLQYSSDNHKTAEAGSTTLDLRLDVAVPPNASAQSPQPLLVWVHGGGFMAGSKEDMLEQALSYARAGYVVASIDYRLTPFERQQTFAGREAAIKQATEDAMNAVRYLKLNASRFHIDTTRTAVLGSSAGGAIALFNAIEFDTLAGAVSDDPAVSSRVDAAIDNAGTYRDATYDSDRFLRYDAGDTPVLLLHANPTDGVTGTTWAGHALPTQQRIAASGNSCTLVAQPDLSHSVDLSLGGPYWAHIQPFLLAQLRLPASP